jgi:hypothetical protein
MMEAETSARVDLLLDDHRGIYIPQGFAQEWAHAFTYPGDPEGYAQDVAALRAGPHAPESYDGEQRETWARILDNAVGRDVFEGYGEGSHAGRNPMAGWRLDQGSGEDGCVRAYHPDDYERVFGEGM